VSILLGTGDFCELTSHFASFCHFRNSDNGGDVDGPRSLIACANRLVDDLLVSVDVMASC
jgi:hypothetical protein